MFVLVTGKPRSGKSYYAVDHLYHNRDKYHKIYANVNGLKMSDNIIPLNFDEVYDLISHCKSIYEHQLSELGKNAGENVIDQPIIDYLLESDFISLNPNYDDYRKKTKDREDLSFIKRLYLNMVNPIKAITKYNSTLLIMDEAQNELPAMNKITGKKAEVDPVISWWISYHGHLYMDVFLLSQNYHKINPAYIYDIEYFLDAVPASRSILGANSRSFTYNHYIKNPFNKTNLAGQKKVKKSKAVFNLYESGDKVRTKSVVIPYIILSIIGLILVVTIFSYVASTLKSSSKEKDSDNNISNTKHYKRKKRNKSHNTVISSNYSQFTYVKLNCIKDVCINKPLKIELYIDDLNKTVVNTQSKFLNVKKYSADLARVTIMASEDFINLFQGAKHEKDKGFSLIN